MMDDLIQKLTQKTGLSTDQAQNVINVVLGHLKEKLPAALTSAMEPHLSGGSAEAAAESGDMGEKLKSVAAGLGGLFGKKTE